MSKIDLVKLSLEDLKKLRKDVDKAIEDFAERKRAEVRKALEELARKHGMSLSEVLRTDTRRRKGKAPAKYRNPDDPSQTWSGRGRQPGWYKKAVSSGIPPEKLKI